MEVSLAGASLVGVEGLTFKATGTVLVNRATDAAGAGAVERINWATATDTASALPVFSAKLTKLVELQVDGSVSLDAFGFVVGTASSSLTKATADVTTGNAALGTAGLLSGARLLSITLTNVNLFAGVGASLNENGTLTNVLDDTITTAGAIGFAVTSGTVKVAVVRPAGLGALDKTSYFGMEVSLAGASLVGVEGLTFKATGTVLVNRATDAAGAGAVERINWATATDRQVRYRCSVRSSRSWWSCRLTVR